MATLLIRTHNSLRQSNCVSKTESFFWKRIDFFVIECYFINFIYYFSIDLISLRLYVKYMTQRFHLFGLNNILFGNRNTYTKYTFLLPNKILFKPNK